jgi:hypothetical protein
MISEDGKPVPVLPLTDKLLSYKIYTPRRTRSRTRRRYKYHIAGCRAECAVGVEMSRR